MKRLLLLPGYLEDATIFDTLRPLLPPAEGLAVELEVEFARWQPTGPVNAVTSPGTWPAATRGGRQ